MLERSRVLLLLQKYQKCTSVSIKNVCCICRRCHIYSNAYVTYPSCKIKFGSNFDNNGSPQYVKIYISSKMQEKYIHVTSFVLFSHSIDSFLISLKKMLKFINDTFSETDPMTKCKNI